MPQTAPVEKTNMYLNHSLMANALRVLSMDAVESAQSGHPGMPMGMADIATVLYSQYLKFDPANPDWADRDRFVLSNGHGSMLLYSLLHLTGYEDMTLEELKNFRQLYSKTAGHPEYGHAKGIETTTGPLGQGFANAVGMALAERTLNAEFGDNLVDHKTYCFVGDGCLMEGISHEAASLAGHLKLNKLIVFFDDNGISIDGPISLCNSEDTLKRFESYGWATEHLDGHDPVAIAKAIERAQNASKPTFIACKTTIAYGAPTKAGTADSHGAPLGAAEIAGARTSLHWALPPFEIPAEIYALWHSTAIRGKQAYKEWECRFQTAETTKKDEFTRRLLGHLPIGFTDKIIDYKREVAQSSDPVSTRKASGLVLDMLTPHMPELIGGSADLTGSNNTHAKGSSILTADHYGGRYLHYGVREHAMAAIMNGLALHKGLIPFGGTFLIFTDYCRPSIRLSALMSQRVIYVMTHDSIGLGEDGPTHQPVEHLASLRAIPNLRVMRPADSVEVAECWELALKHQGPTILALSRQNLPALHADTNCENGCARGGYVLEKPGNAQRHKVTLIATGSELSIATSAKNLLEADGISTSVVSLPCWEIFDEQPLDYRQEVLPPDTLRIAIEAAGPMGWEKYCSPNGFVGMHSFGASAPAKDLYNHFGITALAVVERVHEVMNP